MTAFDTYQNDFIMSYGFRPLVRDDVYANVFVKGFQVR